MARNILILLVMALGVGYIIGTVYNVDTKNQVQQSYDRGYDKGYDEGMCNIARTITGYEQCIVKEIQIGTGRTTKVTISVPDGQSPEDYNTILK